MTQTQTIDQEVTDIFTRSGALQTGHFVLRSGLHSGHYFQCARVGENLKAISRLAELLIQKAGSVDCETVFAPAMGALVIGQEVARQLGKRFIFPEKQEGQLVLRRGFTIKKGEKILIVEDVVTKGGRVQESIDIVKSHGGVPVVVMVLVDRSQGNATFEAPLISLMEMSFPTYEADNLPPELAQIPVSKPGS